MSADRTAALAEVLFPLLAIPYPDGTDNADCAACGEPCSESHLREFTAETAAAILSALPPGWCGHEPEPPKMTDPPGAAEMARWMDRWGREQPARAAITLSVPIEHGYTCGECDWGRADQPHSLAEYVAHVNAEHPTGPHRDFPEQGCEHPPSLVEAIRQIALLNAEIARLREAVRPCPWRGHPPACHEGRGRCPS